MQFSSWRLLCVITIKQLLRADHETHFWFLLWNVWFYLNFRCFWIKEYAKMSHFHQDLNNFHKAAHLSIHERKTIVRIWNEWVQWQASYASVDMRETAIDYPNETEYICLVHIWFCCFLLSITAVCLLVKEKNIAQIWIITVHCVDVHYWLTRTKVNNWRLQFSYFTVQLPSISNRQTRKFFL